MYYAGILRRPRARAPRPFGAASVLLSACIACCACALAHAQSGRTPPPSPAQPTQRTGDSRPRQVNGGRRESPPAFIVVTAPPDGSQENSPFVSGYPPATDFEEVARGASLVALRNLNGVKRAVGDADVPRWEARETALGEDEAWVVWLELKWQQNVSRDAAPFKLRYLLFEPRTGRLVSSGYGRGVRQTWGRPTPRTSIEDQLRNAGRDIAEQVVSELTKAP
ncbi:MAG TPA: hypothetical protein VNZ44_06420 [Pyrinomonadaceae bacterium]|nr:hypothetical protein [Pyrinomonadaceae bacterium]